MGSHRTVRDSAMPNPGNRRTVTTARGARIRRAVAMLGAVVPLAASLLLAVPQHALASGADPAGTSAVAAPDPDRESVADPVAAADRDSASDPAPEPDPAPIPARVSQPVSLTGAGVDDSAGTTDARAGTDAIAGADAGIGADPDPDPDPDPNPEPDPDPAPGPEPDPASPPAPQPAAPLTSFGTLAAVDLGDTVQSVTTEDPATGLRVTRQWAKASGVAGGPVRAGEVLQFHTAVTNTGSRAWTTANPLRYESTLPGLLDDAVLGGSRSGTSASYCAPTQWTSNCGSAIPRVGEALAMDFALAAGATRYFIVRVQVRNDFSAGDQRLLDEAVISGSLTAGDPAFDIRASLAAPVTIQHPDLAIADARWTKVSGDASGPIRAGDVLQYHLAVRNTGAGDWTAKSAWAEARLATIRADVSALRDDAVLIGARSGTSASYCAPTSWTSNCGDAIPLAADGGGAYAESFELKAGATRYFNLRVQVTNDFLAGDQRLATTLAAFGEPGNGEPRIERATAFEDPVVVQHPDLAFADARWTKVSGDASGPIRAGDVLQYWVAVKNTGAGDWTAKSAWAQDRLAAVSVDLAGLRDDAIVIGARSGTSANYCGPTSWTSNCGDAIPAGADGTYAHSFDLKAGATRYTILRVQITNDFEAGDQRLLAAFTASGEPGNGEPRIERTTAFEDAVAVQHPDLAFADARWVKVSGDPSGPIRAGEILQYHVAVKNTGAGDWTAGSAWAKDRLATITADVAGLRDDAVLIGARSGTSASYCGPTDWSIYCGDAIPLAEDGSFAQSFDLKAGATRYFTVRIQITNDFLAGDQRLASVFAAAGEPGNGEPRIERATAFDGAVEVQHPDISIERQVWTKVSGDPNGPVRAGDVLQFHVAVRNTGAGDWTVGSSWADEKLARISTDLSGVLDDAVLLGARAGTSAGYCGPDQWSIYCGDLLPGTSGAAATETILAAGGSISHDFALASGAVRYLNVQVRISDAYTGDQRLPNPICASGEPGNGQPRVEDCGATQAEMVVQYPDVAISLTAAKSPRPTDPLRAGDIVEYTITLENTGSGDWNEASAWAVGNPLTLEMGLADILDDAAVIRQPSGGAEIVDQQVTWTGGLAAGKRKTVDFAVRVGEQAAGSATDLLLRARAVVSGDTRDPDAAPSTVERTAETELSVGERWTLAKRVFRADGTELLETSVVRPGETLEYRVEAASVGGWPVPRVHLVDDASDVFDDAELQGPIELRIGESEVRELEHRDGRIVTGDFVLPGSGTASIVYRVTIPEDRRSGTLRNVATGDATGVDGTAIAPQRCGVEARPCVTEHRISAPAPVIEKRMSPEGPIARGDTIAYTVRVANPGPGAWSERSPLSVVDDLAEVLDDAELLGEPGAEVAIATDADPEAGRIEVVDGRIAWSGPLAAGSWIEFRYEVRVLAELGEGNGWLSNRACTGAPGAERICDEVRAGLPGVPVELDRPQWGGGDEDGCVTPPWIELPITPGVVYTMDGEVVPGGSVTITATPRPGFTLTVPEGWTAAPDGRTATYTVEFPTCEGKRYAFPDVDYALGGCTADGEIVPPSFALVETEGIDYAVEGEVVAGGTITVTATAQPGYTLRLTWNSHAWRLSEDRLSATLVISFHEPICGDDPNSGSGIAPELPKWGGPSCLVPDRAPSLALPETPGLVYTVSGEVAVGSTVTVTVRAVDGGRLGYHSHWHYAADRTSATWRVTYAAPTGCDDGPGGGGGEDSGGPGGGGTDPGGPGGGEDGGGTGGGDPDPDPGPVDPSGDTVVRPIPGLPEPECVAGEVVMPSLEVILVPGVWYDISGEMGPGATVVLTAHTLPGYILQNTADWMTGNWDVADDRRSATQTIVFPTAEELCGDFGTPEVPGVPGEPVDPVDPVGPGVPETPEPPSPGAPTDPSRPGGGGPDPGPTADSDPDPGAQYAANTTPAGLAATGATGATGGLVAAGILGAALLLLGFRLGLGARRPGAGRG